MLSPGSSASPSASGTRTRHASARSIASPSSRGWNATRSSSTSCSRTARFEHERLVLVDLRGFAEMMLEPRELGVRALAHAQRTDVDEAGFRQRVAQRVLVVDETMAPRTKEVVDGDAR